ncbi:MAG TPA: LacI family DNA-binding transcriptional regulator, partial [Solirubrobacter sp.]|nr:LacI family DNA-binding transcriptional regulator [Solirubrobacter sp.]
MRVTLKHIAEELGVSQMTVSNAFNRPDQLSAELRERILKRAREMGYLGPDPLARGLRRGQAGAIGVVSDTPLSYAFEDPAASSVMAGLCSVTEERGLGLVLVP